MSFSNGGLFVISKKETAVLGMLIQLQALFGLEQILSVCPI